MVAFTRKLLIIGEFDIIAGLEMIVRFFFPAACFALIFALLSGLSKITLYHVKKIQFVFIKKVKDRIGGTHCSGPLLTDKFIDDVSILTDKNPLKWK